MPLGHVVPEQLLTFAAAATVFVVMLDIGLGIVPRELRWVFRNPGLVARALFAVLIAVPTLALLVVRALDLPRAAQIGIVLMAISPGAPVALRRSLDAGGQRSFASALQMMVVALAVVSMPLSIAALDELYAGQATIAPGELAKQVFVAQLLPLALGMLVRRAFPSQAERIEPRLARTASVLLVALTILVVVDVWRIVVDAGLTIGLAIASIAALALDVGHLLGGPDPGTRAAVAIGSATRNAGLALLVATLNDAPPGIVATVMAYLVVSAFVVLAYVVWRRRRRPSALSDRR